MQRKVFTKYAHAINQPKISSGHKMTQNDLKPRIVLEWLLLKYDWTYTIEKPIEIRFEIWVFSPFCFFTKPYIEYWPTHITHNIRTISITWTFTWEIMSWLFRVLIMFCFFFVVVVCNRDSLHARLNSHEKAWCYKKKKHKKIKACRKPL